MIDGYNGRSFYIKRTISGMIGKGSINHNERKFYAENVDPSRTKDNITYCSEKLKQVYHELFDVASEKYNDKQTRNDRKIPDYYEHIRKSKQEKLFHEVIFQIGNKDNTAVGTKEGLRAKEILENFMKDFRERNPNLKVFSAHLHMDEATLHLHIDFIPFTENSKRGLETRVSMKQALANQGFLGGSRSETEFNQWINAEKNALAELMLERGIEWEQLGTRNEHLSVLDYKKQERTKEVKELDNQLGGLRKQKVIVENIDKIEIKKIPLSSKVAIEQSDFDKLKAVAGKYVVQAKKENKLEKLLNEAKKVINTLRQKIAELTQELAQYKSIKGGLDSHKLKSENSRLKKENAQYKEILLEHDFKLSHEQIPKDRNNIR